MGGHDHHQPKVPDYKIYRVEEVPKLMEVKKLLACQGLSDPWLRNEVWRYHPKMWHTRRERMMITVTRGLKLGFGAFVVTMIATKLLGWDEDHHHHDH